MIEPKLFFYNSFEITKDKVGIDLLINFDNYIKEQMFYVSESLEQKFLELSLLFGKRLTDINAQPKIFSRKFLNFLNKIFLPKYTKRRLDLSKASKIQMMIFGWKLYITKQIINQ